MKAIATIRKDLDWKTLEQLRKRVEQSAQVKVGIPSSKMEKDGKTPSALVGAAHEFGLGVPERPFLRNTIKNNLPKYVRVNRVNLTKILHGQETINGALGKLGAIAVGDVQYFIAHNDYELDKKTIKRKGSSQALVDEGQMRQSMTWELEEL
ncbi:MAG: hypothetical protein E6R08_06400 [Nevskiaceae bacterium]|nr:MAG: hypothetical protein E6R08_06400 [Nevskiaceae bacterium]